MPRIVPHPSAEASRVDTGRRAVLRRGLVIGLSGVTGFTALPTRANQLKLGELAPPLTLHTVDGRLISTRGLIGNVVVVTFWATWCAPCLDELPVLSSYAARHAGDGLQVLGFSLDASEDIAKVNAAAAALSFPVGLLGSPWAGGYGRIWRCPVSFVIDRSGRLVDNGWDDAQPAWTEARLEELLTPLLARRS